MSFFDTCLTDLIREIVAEACDCDGGSGTTCPDIAFTVTTPTGSNTQTVADCCGDDCAGLTVRIL